MRNKTILIGPYVGSFQEELITFKPFVDWFKCYFDYKKLYVCTHYNRNFLYEDVEKINFLKIFSSNDCCFDKHLNDKISIDEYNYLKKDIINEIIWKNGLKRTDVINFDIGYNKASNVSYYQKKFEKVKCDKESTDYIVFIPDKSRTEKELKGIYNFLKFFWSVVVINGKQFGIDDDTIVTSDNLYSNMMKHINNCKCIITPCSDWTFIANLQNKPVFSWGRKNTSIYKELYNFDNKNSRIININKINDEFLNSMRKFINEH